MLKKFKDLTEKEILAIAISAERKTGGFTGSLRTRCVKEYPSTAEMFEDARGRSGPPRPFVCDVPSAVSAITFL